MSTLRDWQIPAAVQPRPEDYAFDLDAALAAMVDIRSVIPPDAFTADTLGVERLGNGVLIDGGLVLTIGYLIIEAEAIWLTFSDGRAVEGHMLAYDQESGFGLVQPLARLDLPGLPLGDPSTAAPGERVVVAGAGGRAASLSAHVVGRQEFAGYWEYVLDDAIFTAPAHPHWGGTAVLGKRGEILGIGSLQLQGADEDGDAVPLNMVVPVDVLTPILEDLRRFGRSTRPVKPWLGLYATGMENVVVVIGIARRGPSEAAGVVPGDVVSAVAGEPVSDLAGFYRKVWEQGPAGVEVPLTLEREGRKVEVRIRSGDRNDLLKAPSVH